MARFCWLVRTGCKHFGDGFCNFNPSEQEVVTSKKDFLDLHCAEENSVESTQCTESEFKEIQVTYMSRMLAAIESIAENQK